MVYVLNNTCTWYLKKKMHTCSWQIDKYMCIYVLVTQKKNPLFSIYDTVYREIFIPGLPPPPSSSVGELFTTGQIFFISKQRHKPEWANLRLGNRVYM